MAEAPKGPTAASSVAGEAIREVSRLRVESLERNLATIRALASKRLRELGEANGEATPRQLLGDHELDALIECQALLIAELGVWQRRVETLDWRPSSV